VPRKTILVHCPHPDCYELMPQGAKGCCKEHAHAASGRECITDGCTTIIHGHGARTFCDACAKARKLMACKSYNKQIAEQVEVAKPKRREPARIVKTSEQVDRECRKEERRLAEVYTGLNHDLLNARRMRGAISYAL
jgi:hypothetical protein